MVPCDKNFAILYLSFNTITRLAEACTVVLKKKWRREAFTTTLSTTTKFRGVLRTYASISVHLEMFDYLIYNISHIFAYI